MRLTKRPGSMIGALNAVKCRLLDKAGDLAWRHGLCHRRRVRHAASQPNENPLPVHLQAARKKGRFNCCRRTKTPRRSSGGVGWF